MPGHRGELKLFKFRIDGEVYSFYALTRPEAIKIARRWRDHVKH